MEHWLNQLEFQTEWMRKALAEKRYDDIRRALTTMASMVMFSAIATAESLVESAKVDKCEEEE